MALLIDGYNLLHVTGIFGRGRGPGSLERSRNALLNFVAAAVDPAELPQTTVVFDAKEAPPGLPRTVTHRGITVHFAAEFEEADDLLEELIRTEPSPRKLLVVSSDHRVQRAAKRRRAATIDSDVWYDEAKRHRRDSAGVTSRDVKPDSPSVGEVNRWLEAFGFPASPPVADSTPNNSPPIPESAESLPQPKPASQAEPKRLAKPPTTHVSRKQPPQSPANRQAPPTSSPPDKSTSARKPPPSRPRKSLRRSKPRQLPEDEANPFPPGYADDLFDES
ncbi:MAG: NYN domain-containing protein [Planctomycetales bacterium]|nr:NYN domain-containing protein [Planctomycetales bacterium]